MYTILPNFFNVVTMFGASFLYFKGITILKTIHNIGPFSVIEAYNSSLIVVPWTEKSRLEKY